MARKSNEEQKAVKRDMILEQARTVFCEKGFLSVTMKDIVDVCGISRGGLYLFFSSIEEIFEAVVVNRNLRRLFAVRRQVTRGKTFQSVLELYFAVQKERLLHMEESILMATYEYYSVHGNPEDLAFREEQVQGIKADLVSIFRLGVEQEALCDERLDELAESYIYLIEGLSVYAMLGNVNEEQIDMQIEQMKSMLPWREGRAL